jgi:tRNA(Ile)-lysidine synthase
MEQSKKLQDYFVDRKVDEPLRDHVPILCSGDSIVWIVGYAIDAKVAVTENTTNYLLVEVDDALA